MYIVTITERTPTPPEQKEVVTHHVICESMFDAVKLLEEGEMNFTCWVNVNIAYVKDEK